MEVRLSFFVSLTILDKIEGPFLVKLRSHERWGFGKERVKRVIPQGNLIKRSEALLKIYSSPKVLSRIYMSP